jgi:uncharacterized membrane protein
MAQRMSFLLAWTVAFLVPSIAAQSTYVQPNVPTGPFILFIRSNLMSFSTDKYRYPRCGQVQRSSTPANSLLTSQEFVS